MALQTDPAKFKREDLKPGEVLCTYCTGRCCRYFALPLETPETRDDFDHIRWYMLHGDVNVFVEGEDWYLVVNNVCRHLLPDNRCGIYDDRPSICRKYTTEECEFDDDAVYDKYFETPEQVWEYAEALLPHEFPPSRTTSSRELSLPVLSSV